MKQTSALDRVSGVAQIDELDAFDDPAVLDVETGDDAGFEGHSAAAGKAAVPFMKSKNTPSILPEQSDRGHPAP
jgi:hypothetical protein